MPKKAFCFFIFISFCAKISAQKGSNTKISHLLILPPITKIYVINTKNQLEYSDSLSALSAKHLQNLIPAIIPDSFICHQVKPLPSNNIITDTLYSIIKSAKKWSRLKKVQVPDIILQYLDSLHQDFAFFVILEGFERTDENFKVQDKQAIVSNYFLGAFYKWLPTKSASIMTGLIIERESQKFRYFNRTYVNEPSNKSSIRPQLYDLIMSHYQTL
jgi:hypothetical protein